MYRHWLTRLLAFLLNVQDEPELPAYVAKYLNPRLSTEELSELHNARWD